MASAIAAPDARRRRRAREARLDGARGLDRRAGPGDPPGHRGADRPEKTSLRAVAPAGAAARPLRLRLRRLRRPAPGTVAPAPAAAAAAVSTPRPVPPVDQSVGVFSLPSSKRQRGLASRSWLPVALSFGTEIDRDRRGAGHLLRRALSARPAARGAPPLRLPGLRGGRARAASARRGVVLPSARRDGVRRQRVAK